MVHYAAQGRAPRNSLRLQWSIDLSSATLWSSRSPTAPTSCISRFLRRAISPKRSTSWSRGLQTAFRSRPCSASLGRARLTPWRTSSPVPAGRRWCSRPTRRLPRSSTRNFASSCRATRSSTSSPTTITISPKRTCRRATCTSRRTRRSTSTSSRCVCPRPRRSSNAPTASSSPPCRRSTASATLRNTTA